MSKHTPTLLRFSGNPSGSFRISTDCEQDRSICHHLTPMASCLGATFEESAANGIRLAACWNAFHSPDREIATEQIEPGLFWEMRAELQEARDKLEMFIAENEDPGADAMALQYRLSALLAKLEPQK